MHTFPSECILHMSEMFVSVFIDFKKDLYEFLFLYRSIMFSFCFQYGRAEVASKSRPLLLYDEGEEEDDGGGGEAEKSAPLAMNGVANGAPPLISRDKLILVPDGSLPSSEEGGRGDANGGDEGGSEERYTLANCLDYVKAGVEAIIEDQVTSRFEAEELKNWNLLTRTNRHYEFISWRLTVIWMFGFVIRYFFLLPLRVLICFIGVSIGGDARGVGVSSLRYHLLSSALKELSVFGSLVDSNGSVGKRQVSTHGRLMTSWLRSCGW